MRELLQPLAAVTAVEADVRRRAAVELRDAFVYRETSSLDRPSAAEYAVGQMCARARRMRHAHEARRLSGGCSADLQWQPLRLALTPSTCPPSK